MKRLLLSILFIIQSCSSNHLMNPLSVTKDIFLEDNDPSSGRRRHANHEEILRTIKLKGCTGHLIHPNYMMTAAHCKIKVGDKFQSGSNLVKGDSTKDVSVKLIIENNTRADFTIAEITWLEDFPKEQKFTSRIASSEDQIHSSLNIDEGDEVFTVGFPADKKTATYSEGRLKRYNVLHGVVILTYWSYCGKG